MAAPFFLGRATLVQALQRWSPRAFGFVYLNPKQTQASLEELDRCVRDGPMVGVKLWVARHCYAPELDPITERATTLKACIRTITVTNWTNLRLRGF